MKRLACGLLVLVTPAAGLCATIYVPDDFATIQGAIDAAANGDEVLVRPGTYIENIDFLGKAILVKGIDGPELTVIDGGEPVDPDRGSAVTFENGEGPESRLEGFTLTNGLGHGWAGPGAGSGGGVYCHASSPTMTGNVVKGNYNLSQGGGIACAGACSPLITFNVISSNTAYDGGGIACSSGADAVIRGNTISGNTAYSVNDGGGGICCKDAEPEITANVLTGNVAYYGGGMLCEGKSPVISGNRIEDNIALSRGGGVHCDSSSPFFADNAVRFNWAGSGGGISARFTASPAIHGNLIEGNTAGDGGAVYCENEAAPALLENRILENTALGKGGGVYFEAVAGTVEVGGNEIRGNTAYDQGGGLYAEDLDDLRLSSNLIASNRAAADAGGGLFASFCTLASVNDTISQNSAGARAGGIYCGVKSHAAVANAILWHNSAPAGPEMYVGSVQAASEVSVSFSDIEGGASSIDLESGCTLNFGAGMIDADPLFAEAAAGDFHVAWTSPCRNAGDNAAVSGDSDVEGDPRIAGGAVDMGADEFYFHLYYTGDVTPGGTIAVKVVGGPGMAPVRLALGSGIQDPPQPTPFGDLYLTLPPLAVFDLGSIPGSGVLSFPATVPASWAPGETKPLQALAGAPGGGWARLTNLMILEVE